MKRIYIRKSKLLILITIAVFASATRRLNAQGTQENIGIQEYTVEPGDNLHHIITRKQGLSAERIKYVCFINGIKDPNRIYVGQKLGIPTYESLNLGKPNLYSLQVGIDSGASPILWGCANDAKCLFNQMIILENNSFKDVIAEKLINQAATRDNIRAHIKRFIQMSRQENDKLLLTLSGHMIVLNGVPQIVTYGHGIGVLRGGREQIMISPDTLSKWLEHPNNPRLSVIIVLDNCYAQSFAKAFKSQNQNIAIITAAQVDETAREIHVTNDDEMHLDCNRGHHYHGRLSYQLIEGMQKMMETKQDTVFYFNDWCTSATHTFKFNNTSQSSHIAINFIPNFPIVTIRQDSLNSPPSQGSPILRGAPLPFGTSD